MTITSSRSEPGIRKLQAGKATPNSGQKLFEDSNSMFAFNAFDKALFKTIPEFVKLLSWTSLISGKIQVVCIRVTV